MHESVASKNIRPERSILERLKDVLPVIVVATAIVSTWSYFRFSISSLEKRTDAIEILQKSQTASVYQIIGQLEGVNDKLDLIISGRITR